MKAAIQTAGTTQKVKVNNYGGTLTSVGGVTLRNQVVEINSIESIADVNAVDKATGSTIVYNASNLTYEVKPLDYEYLSGSIDCGTF